MKSINSALEEGRRARKGDTMPGTEGETTEEEKLSKGASTVKEEQITVIPSSGTGEREGPYAATPSALDKNGFMSHSVNPNCNSNRKSKIQSTSHNAYSGGYTSIPSAPTPMALSGSLQNSLSQQQLLSFLYAQNQVPPMGAYQPHHQLQVKQQQQQQQVVYLQPILYQPLLTEMNIQSGLNSVVCAPGSMSAAGARGGIHMPSSTPHIPPTFRRTTSTQTLYQRT